MAITIKMESLLDKWAKRHQLSLSDAADAILVRRIKVRHKTYRRAVEVVLDGGVTVSLSVKIEAMLTRSIDEFREHVILPLLNAPPLYDQLKCNEPIGLFGIVTNG
jgi:hypothetical protein